MIELSAVNIYPIKSCAPCSLASATVQPRGLQGDRRWMIVDADGRFISGRQQPRLVLLRAQQVEGDGWRLSAPAASPLTLQAPPADAERVDVSVWSSQIRAPLADAAANRWISAYLGQPARFVYMDADTHRPVAAEYAQPGDEVSFADGFPLLLISTGSLAGLNARLARPVTMGRFRPNLVVSTDEPHAEDRWRRIRIGAVSFDVVKPCSRCVFTTVDPQTATFDSDREPIRTLSSYRRQPGGVMFGQNLIARGTGVLRVGDGVEVLSER